MYESEISFAQKAELQRRTNKSYQLSLLNSLLGNKYSVNQKIGIGKHSIIYKSININNKKPYIIKFYNLSTFSEPIDPQTIRKMVHERVKLYRNCPNNPNIIKCYQLYQNNQYMALVLEYCNFRTLSTHLQHIQFIDRDVFNIMRQVINGVNQLHQKGYIVGSLRPEKILVKNNTFKLTRYWEPQLHQELNDPFLAPEIRNCLQYDENADVWALAHLYFYSLLKNEQMYDKLVGIEQQYKEFSTLFTKQIENTTSPLINNVKVQEFLKKSMQKNPKHRLKWQQINKSSPFSIQLSCFYEQTNFWKPSTQTPNPKFTPESVKQPIKTEQFVLKALSQCDLAMYCEQKQQDEPLLQITYQLLFEVQRVQYIHTNIILPLQNKLECQQIKYIQLMFLLYSRSFIDLSTVKSKLKISTVNETSTLLNYNTKIQKIYTIINNKFNLFSTKLTKQESKFSNIISNGITKTFSKPHYKQLNQILCGVEGLDYSRQKQIELTMSLYSKYIEKRVNENLVQSFRMYEQLCKMKRIKGVAFIDQVNKLMKVMKTHKK